MKFIPSSIFSDVITIKPDVYHDKRGHFLEVYQLKRYLEHGLPATFVQDNFSFSKRRILRGLHYQLNNPQGKLIWVVQGEIYDVVADIRKDSPTFRKWLGITLSSKNHHQLYIPEGFAHGFCVLSETALVQYKCTDYYDPSSERGLIWNDPVLNIDWPISYPILSDKDRSFPLSHELSERDIPVYQG